MNGTIQRPISTLSTPLFSRGSGTHQPARCWAPRMMLAWGACLLFTFSVSAQSLLLTVYGENGKPVSEATVLLKNRSKKTISVFQTDASGELECAEGYIQPDLEYDIEITAEGHQSLEFPLDNARSAQRPSIRQVREVFLTPLHEAGDFHHLNIPDHAFLLRGGIPSEEDVKGFNKRELHHILKLEVIHAKRSMKSLMASFNELQALHQDDIETLNRIFEFAVSLRDSVARVQQRADTLLARNQRLEAEQERLSREEEARTLSLRSAHEANQLVTQFPTTKDAAWDMPGEFDFGESWYNSFPHFSFIPIGWSSSGHFAYMQVMSDGYTDAFGMLLNVLGPSRSGFDFLFEESFFLSHEDGPSDIDPVEVLAQCQDALREVIHRFDIVPSGIGDFEFPWGGLTDFKNIQGEGLRVQASHETLRFIHDTPGGRSTLLFEQDRYFWNDWLEQDYESELYLLGATHNPQSNQSLVFVCSSHGGGMEGDVENTLRAWYHVDGRLYGPIRMN